MVRAQSFKFYIHQWWLNKPYRVSSKSSRRGGGAAVGRKRQRASNIETWMYDLSHCDQSVNRPRQIPRGGSRGRCFLTSHRRPQGNVHVAQVSLAALHQQLGRRAAVAEQGALLAGRHAALLEERRAVGHREGGEAPRACAALPADAGRPVANALGHRRRAGITWLIG